MTSRIISLVSLLFVVNFFQAQEFDWVESFEASSNILGNPIAVDLDGNLYITGQYSGTVDFDPGPGTANLTSSGFVDFYVLKLDANGDLLWAKSVGIVNNTVGLTGAARSIAVDPLGNVYTTGLFRGTVDFDPGPGTVNLTSQGDSDIFVLKLDTNGNYQWAKALGASSPESGLSVFADAMGNVFTTGWFYDTVDFDPGPGTVNLTSQGNTDIFILKLDTNGNYQWARAVGGNGPDRGRSMTVDSFGNVYTTGDFTFTVDFDPGSGSTNLTSQGSKDIFIQKLDGDGNFVWAVSMGGSEVAEDSGISIKVDASGNVYSTGQFFGTVDFNPGSGTLDLISQGVYDIYVQKLDTNGNFVWAKSFGGVDYDYIYSMSLDIAGNVYTTGYFTNMVDFDPGPGTVNLTPLGGTDTFIQKLDTNGDFLWTITMGGESAQTLGYSIYVLPIGTIYSSGEFAGTVDFDPGSGMEDLTSQGSNFNVFALKLNQEPLSVELPAGILRLNVFPNPTSGDIMVASEEVLNDVELILTNLSGQLILQQVFKTLSTTQIELPSAAGVYFLTLRTANGQSTVKLIKQ